MSEIQSLERSLDFSRWLRNGIRCLAGVFVAAAAGLGIASEFSSQHVMQERAGAIFAGIGAFALIGASELANEDYRNGQELLALSRELQATSGQGEKNRVN